jgi:HAE1 family hydrophobic/amphiphilic exporter-1
VIADIIQHDPNVESVASTAGAGGRNSSGNSGTIFIGLKPINQRQLSADEVAEELRGKLSREPGLRVIVQNPPSINVGGRQGRSLYQVTLQSNDTKELYDNVDLLQKKMKELPTIQDVNTDLQLNSPQVNVEINRKQASALGVSIAQIQSALGDAFGSRQLSTIYTPTNEYQVILEIKPESQQDPNVLQQLYVSSSTASWCL